MYSVSQTRDPGVIDVSVSAPRPWGRLSLWYEHGQIPVPTLHGMYSSTVNGIMQALLMVGKNGTPGHINLGYLVGGERYRAIQEGEVARGWLVNGLPRGLGEARKALLIPAYHWVLENPAAELVAVLKQRHRGGDVVLFDGIPNHDIDDPRPLSHAMLLAQYLNAPTLH